MILEAYHGTDLNSAQNILKTDFIYRANKEHWLGNGIYFYMDLSLAKWWTSNPSRKFGVRVNSPAILNVKLKLQDDEILDLRKLDDYNQFINLYYDEYIPLLKLGILEIPPVNQYQIRCSFCDYLEEQYGLKAIIGNFSLLSQPYLPSRYKLFTKAMKLYYIETQLCVFDTDCIISKDIIYGIK